MELHKLQLNVCRIRFGSNNLYIFCNPNQAKKLDKAKLREFSYEDAMLEIVKHSGIEIKDGGYRELLLYIQTLIATVNFDNNIFRLCFH